MGSQAFDSKRQTAFLLDPRSPAEGGQCILIGLDEGDETHHLYDKRVHDELNEDMVNNIHRHGIIQNITIQKDGENRAIIIAGRRRILHAREVRRRQIEAGEKPIYVPAVVRRGNDAAMLGVYVSENEQREDDSITAKAEKAQRLLDSGYTEEQVAETFGVTVTNVTANWLPLLHLADQVRAAVDGGRISASAGAKLGSLSKQDQREHLKEMLAEGNTTTAEAGRRARNTKNKGKTTKNGAAVEASPKPKTRLVKKALALEAAAELSPDFVKGIKFMLGELDAGQIKGLKALLREADTKKKPPQMVAEE